MNKATIYESIRWQFGNDPLQVSQSPSTCMLMCFKCLTCDSTEEYHTMNLNLKG